MLVWIRSRDFYETSHSSTHPRYAFFLFLIYNSRCNPKSFIIFLGLGDYTPEAVSALDDPCPLPMKERVLRRSLNEKEKVIYAPFSGVGGIVYDHDAVYIDLGGSHSHREKNTLIETGDGSQQEAISPFVSEMRELKATLNEKMNSASMQLFSSSQLNSSEMEVDQGYENENEEFLKKKVTPRREKMKQVFLLHLLTRVSKLFKRLMAEVVEKSCLTTMTTT